MNWALFLCYFALHGWAELVQRLSIAENEPIGSLVGMLTHSDAGANDMNGVRYFFIYPPESQVEQSFTVDERSGEIRTRQVLDRESKASYVFLAIPVEGTEGIRVIIDVQDRNDNAPAFPPPAYVELQLSEYAKLESEVPLPSAQDMDSAPFDVQRYEIVSGNVNNAFRLSTKRINQILYLDLVINAELDREFRDYYILKINALDGGRPPLRDTLTVNVTILDVNDNPPVFDRPRYEVHLGDVTSVVPGSPVLTVHASDQDAGLNGQVEYRLAPSPGDAQRYFSIDPKSGLITWSSAQKMGRFYELLVLARDKGQQPLESSAFVTVSSSVGSEKLKIKTIFLSSDGSASLPEDTAPGSLIARVSVTEPSSAHRNLRCTLSLEGDQASTFAVKVSEEINYLILNKPVDRESQQWYNMTIKAAACGRSTKTTSRPIKIRITDVNDNPPRFEMRHYTAHVSEKAAPGTSVIRVQALDADEGPNGQVRYSLTSKHATYERWFRIDPVTGLITTADTVDCELSFNPQLIITAQDQGSLIRLNDTASLSISILDVNDNPPLFKKPIYEVSVAENASIGHCIVQVEAVDPDCGKNAEVHYDLENGTSISSLFIIDRTTGWICLGGELDYEQRTNYEIVVSASDGGGLSSTTIIRVNVLDVNDNAPIFYPLIYNVSLRQSVAPGTPVLVVSAADLDSGPYGKVTYSLESKGDESPFRLDEHKGECYVNGKLSPTVYQLRVKATDQGGLTSEQMATITVTVLTESFPTPHFEEKFYRFRVREDALPGIVVGQVRAHGQGPISYGIYSGDPDGWFSVDPSSGEIQVAKYLDHEAKQSVLLNIQAALGHPASYNHSQVQVLVEDINDNPPVFERTSVRISVLENHDPSLPIFTAKATDKDSGNNGDIRYRLTMNPENTFMIHPLNGEVRVNPGRSLDYETRKNYALNITAEDDGLPSLSAKMNLFINIVDVNDHTPEFLQKIYRASVAENAPTMTRIVQLKAVDLDDGANGQIIFGLQLNPGDQNNETMEMFDIFADSGWIYLRKAVDREAVSEYSFTATVRDNGQPRRSSTASVSIKVLDVNDNAPRCAPAVQEFITEENRPIGSKVGQVFATDPDQGPNGTVRYRLEPSETDAFQITVQGSIVTTEVLDFETKDMYEFNVVAYDAGQPSLSAQCPVKIRIRDVNDNAPLFILPPHSASIFFREEQSIGTEVFQVQAKDLDQGKNGTVRYRIDTVRSTTPLPFRINSKTGIVYSTAVLDYEQGLVSYKLAIIAEDMGVPPLSTSKIFTIQLLNVEDGIHPTSAQKMDTAGDVLAFEVSELAPVGTLLGSVDERRSADIAASKHADEQSALEQLIDTSYSISSGNSMAIFDVDPFTGELFIVKRLDYEIANFHFLTVARTNISQSNGAKVKKILIKIKVIDENDNAPQFPEDPVVFSLPESTPVGSEVWLYNATDADTGKYGRIRYRVIDGHGVFSVDPLRGALQLSSSLDHENCTEYMVVVEATDQAASPKERRSTQVTTRIYVVDVNDNAPIFISNDTVFVYEDAPTDYPLFYVIATDADWLENGRVTYSIKEKNINNKFAVNSSTGALTLTSRLGKDDPSEYRFTVEAVDHGVPPLAGSQLLRVKVLSVSMDNPRFEKSLYLSKIVENSNPGTAVAHVKANERNKSVGISSGNLIYELLPGTYQDRFLINSTTGVITTTVSLDREEIDQIPLAVIVQNDKALQHYDTTIVRVIIEDVNDNRPRINQDSCHQLSLPENVKVANLVNIQASDPDVGLNGRLAYSIIEGNVGGKFRINAQTGRLACEPLDRETVAVYNLTILVTDSGAPRLSDTCSLVITVIDENDNEPKFNVSTYAVDVQEDTVPGSVIVMLHAVDIDEGHNGLVTYCMANDTNGLFDVKPNTGEVVILRPLDFETSKEHIFYVRASDQGAANQLSQFAAVHVHVTDVNDNAPQFEKYPVETVIPSKLTSGQRIVKVSATDADGEGPNSELHYSLLDPATQFSINPDTGVISAKTETVLTPGSVSYLKIAVADKGEPSMRTAGVVKTIVYDEQNTVREYINFERSLYHFVYNGLDKSSSLGTVHARIMVNPASGVSRVNYEIISGNEDGLFKIDSDKGKITATKNALQREVNSKQQYNILIQATITSLDRAINNAQAFCNVIVQMMDGNAYVPYFLQQVYTVAIPEGQPRGFHVIQVSAVDLDIRGDGKLTYSIVSGNLDSAFSIDSLGQITTRVELDREIKDRYELTVSTTDFSNSPTTGQAKVRVTVLDINDNSPSFPPSRPITIREDTPVGSFITTVTANDVDTFPSLEYSFTPDGNPGKHFSINRFSGRIMLMKPLNYEQRKTHNLQIKVSDGKHNAYARLPVRVLDVNDNAPIFGKLLYQFSVPLGTLRGSNLGQTVAIDRDMGDYGRLNYRLIDHSDGAAPGCWIEPELGILYLNETLTRLDKYSSLSKLVVEASDNGNPPRSSRAPVILQLLPITSVERVRFAQPVFSFTVSENYPIHTIIVQLDVIQSPSHSNQVSYSIQEDGSNGSSGMFEIDPLGRLVLLKSLDRELKDEHRLLATIHSREHSTTNSTAIILVKVDDVNDNRPVFSQHEYKASIDQSMSPGTMVLKLTATDRDIGQNARLHFEITSGNTGDAFAIDSDTGVVSVNRKLSDLTVEDYKLVVKATDSGLPPLSALAMCHVKVRSSKSQSGPFFPVSLYLGHISENAPAGSPLFIVKAATDGNAEKRSISYHIKSVDGEDDWKHFSINKDTGLVQTKKSFDYEQQTSYKFTVTVSDSLGHEHSVPCQVLVKGVDEFAPAFSEQIYVFKASYEAKTGERIGTVYADDQDAGSDGRVAYQIKENSAYFDINPNTGVIFLKKDLSSLSEDESELRKYVTHRSSEFDNEQYHSFQLTVIAYSGADPMKIKSNSTTVEIQVRHVTVPPMSVGIILLIIVVIVISTICCCVICTAVIVRRRRPQVRTSLKSVSYPKQSRQKLNSTSSKCGLIKGPLSRNGAPKRCSTGSLFGSVDLTNIDDKLPSFTFNPKRAVKSGSDYSVKSSGRGSYEEESPREADQTQGQLSEPDSAMHSWLYDEPPLGSDRTATTHAYLTNLGIEPDNHIPPESVSAVPQATSTAVVNEDDINLHHLIYSKVDEVLSSHTLDRHANKFRIANPSCVPVPNQHFNRATTLRGLAPPSNWGPGFKPVTQVLSEITRIRGESANRKSSECLPLAQDPWVKRTESKNGNGRGYHTLPKLLSESRLPINAQSDGEYRI